MGTRFIATAESMAGDAYKQMLVDSDADDVMLTTAFTGLRTNMLKPSMIAAGLDPEPVDEQVSADRSRTACSAAAPTPAGPAGGPTSGRPGTPCPGVGAVRHRGRARRADHRRVHVTRRRDHVVGPIRSARNLSPCRRPPRRPSLRSPPGSTPASIELLQAERDRWCGLDADLAGPFEEIRRMVRSGGKRLRPAFCHWGFVGAGGDPDDERVVRAGAAFELMHAFALFHDDVMDDSASRRGAPTTHAVYADEHGRETWAGESRRFGEGVAILVGDLAFVLADQLLIGAPVEVWELWNELRIELNIGQYLDLLGSVQSERRLVKAERIARYKSGKYTIERPLHLGATLAAPDRRDELLPALSALRAAAR